MDHTEVARLRENSIKAPGDSLPDWRIRNIILGRLQPINIDLDPYLASVLIALAQAQWYAYSDNITALPSSYIVRTYFMVSSLQVILINN
jgi:hypothetical protein